VHCTAAIEKKDPQPAHLSQEFLVEIKAEILGDRPVQQGVAVSSPAGLRPALV